MHGPAPFSILMYFLELSIQDEVVTNGCVGKRKRHERNIIAVRIVLSASYFKVALTDCRFELFRGLLFADGIQGGAYFRIIFLLGMASDLFCAS